MFDSMGPVKRLALLSTVLFLAAPAAALGAETTVDAASGGACAQGGVCKTIGAAVAVSASGDTLKVKAGAYAEDVTVPADKANLVLNGEAGVSLTGSLAIDAPGAKVNRLVLARTAGSAPALTAAGGTFELRDSVVVSTVSTAVSVTGGAGNLIQRSTIAATAANADGVRLTSSNAGARALSVDSSILLGGDGGAAARVLTSGMAGDAALALNHVTAVSKGGLVLDASAATATLALPPAPAGNITATVNSSIVHGASTARTNALPVAANAVTATYVKSDADAMTAAGGTPAIVKDATPRTGDSALFGKNLRLKLGSPAIDAGGAIVAGESDTDIDGEPRTSGSQPDIGADEYLNGKPSVTFTAEPSSVRAGQAIAFTAKATDPNGADDVAAYGFDFGDGSKAQQSTTPTVTHTYAKNGTYKVQVAAVDKSGGVSDIATQTIVVDDGTPPLVKIASPAYGRKLKLKRKPLKIAGAGSDESGLDKIEIAITRVSGGCAQYTGSRFAKAGCKKYRWVKAKLSGNGFKLTTKAGLRIKSGTYEIRARGTDKKGNASVVFSKQNNLVRFRVR